jgi:hypothetical protein
MWGFLQPIGTVAREREAALRHALSALHVGTYAYQSGVNPRLSR